MCVCRISSAYSYDPYFAAGMWTVSSKANCGFTSIRPRTRTLPAAWRRMKPAGWPAHDGKCYAISGGMPRYAPRGLYR
jgi:hypothetical protein